MPDATFDWLFRPFFFFFFLLLPSRRLLMPPRRRRMLPLIGLLRRHLRAADVCHDAPRHAAVFCADEAAGRGAPRKECAARESRHAMSNRRDIHAFLPPRCRIFVLFDERRREDA